MLYTGVRVSECISIRLDDVDWERRRVLVRQTKNKHDRWVGVGERTASALRDHVERFRGDRPGELFLTGAGKPMASGNTVRVILRRMAEQLGLEKVHPHRFRHTFATWAIQSGAREIDVAPARRSFVLGATFGAGMGIACPMPTYYALLGWVVVAASAWYGALVLAAYGLGRMLVPVVLGLLIVAGTSRRTISARLAAIHTRVEWASGVVMAGLGIFMITLFGGFLRVSLL